MTTCLRLETTPSCPLSLSPSLFFISSFQLLSSSPVVRSEGYNSNDMGIELWDIRSGSLNYGFYPNVNGPFMSGQEPLMYNIIKRAIDVLILYFKAVYDTVTIFICLLYCHCI